jgi:copper chaperone CopZ
MNTNTTKSTTRTLKIDGMSGDDCVQKVKGALDGVNGVETESVRVGAATIGADKSGCDAACRAIDQAGYQAREQSGSDSRNQYGNDERNQTGGDSRNQSGNDSRNQAAGDSRNQPANDARNQSANDSSRNLSGDDAGQHSGARPATAQGRDRQPQKGDQAQTSRR